MFFAALRISEMISIQASDMFISNTNVKKNISRSKTDQMGRGNWINLYACSGSSVCLVKL